ncbi:SLC13 family permease [Allofournierella massiliensis]|uniref:Di/tricarboxylate transporter n=1 Tax=Allofournierella massiliensis TaxID=1650663 RepID=A0A4R1QYW6_9FIRM|nr:SLC13 family permease [Fournierella massiliensis]TCL58161.1 di/tricarboxylate transporter [Fournierella massiliensis]
MTIEMIIVLAILAFMVVMLLTRIIPYGVTAMICCVAFVLTGVCDLSTAFSGLSNSTTIMVATMIVVATALGKTSLVHRLRGVMTNLQGKQGIFLVVALYVITIALSQLMGQIACLSIMLLFVQTLDEKSSISPARMLFAVACINTIWTSKIPIGMGATMPGTINSFYQGMVGPEDLLAITDYFKAGILPAIVGTLYCILCYKLIPSGKIDNSQVKDVKETEALSRRDEIITFLVFFLVMGGFMFSNQLGSDVTNVLPAAGVLILILTKVLSVKEAVSTLTSDMVWMIAGMTVMSSVLGSTGVGDLIGNTVLNILGSNPSGLFVSIVFCVVTTILTNFLSNMGTMALMCPIAAATAQAGGMNVKAVVLVAAVSSWFAIAMPTGCAGAMMAFGIGNHNAFKVMKFTLPLVLLLMISLIIGVNLFFPIYN